MTENELILFLVLAGIGVIFGGIWSALATLKWNNLGISIIPGAIVPVGVVQMLFIIESGIGAMILLPGLGMAIGGPAALSAFVTSYCIRKKREPKGSEQDGTGQPI